MNMLANKTTVNCHSRFIDRQESTFCRHPSAACCLLLLLCGCGTSEYERRLESRPTTSKFDELYGPQELPGVPVSVRVPVLFKASPLVEGALVDGKPIDPRRVKPSLVALPGLKLTYEAFIEDSEGGKLPYYCYVGALNISNNRGPKPENSIHNELAGRPAYESLTEWADYQGETPEGRGNDWKKVRCASEQDFMYTDKNGKQDFRQMPGVIDIFLHEEAGMLVVIAWRMPKSIEPHVAKWEPLVAGCVSVKR